jgi:asparagine synthase (glutamine-hydrolysing)
MGQLASSGGLFTVFRTPGIFHTMCGIAGVLDLSGQGVEPGLPGRMIETIRHRGPDGEGVYTDARVGLGHARLSVIDVAGGAQPMSIADQSLWITFNGEIFNYIELRDELVSRGHRFRTRSDTEVLLHLYQEEGERCVERLNGQWAFAIWDARHRKLFLSRDRLGVRPLFYTQTSGSFFFASEIKALLACPGVDPHLDLKALHEIFTFWVTLPSRTVFRGVQELPPGHSMCVENGALRIWEYWRLALAPQEADPRTPGALAEELLELLSDATRIRLRADVPVGAYLSGGLDSTLIAALARKTAGDRLRTFSISFDDPELDESAYQEQASEFLDTRHSMIRCRSGDIAAVFSEVVRHAEKPVLRTAPAPLYLLARRVRKDGFKVVLTGEGADEMMGGYDIFKEAKIRRFWGRYPESAWRPLLLRRLYPYMGDMQRQSGSYLRRFFQVNPEDLASPFFSHLPRWRLSSKIKSFLSPEVRAEVGPYDPLRVLEDSLPPFFRDLSSFGRSEFLEARLLLPGYILSSQGDRVAMAHGVEARYPFLDYRVVEFSAGLSPRLKMHVLDEKHLLKRASRGLIPESVRTRPKQPYRAPDGPSFFGSEGEFVEDVLSQGQIRRNGVFDPQMVSRLVRKFRSGNPTSVGDNMALVGILSTELLIDLFVNRGEGMVSHRIHC